MTQTERQIAEKGYTHPEALVTTAWVADHSNDENVRIVESDEDVLLYEIGQTVEWFEEVGVGAHSRRHQREINPFLSWNHTESSSLLHGFFTASGYLLVHGAS